MTVPLFILYSLGETKAEEDNIRTYLKNNLSAHGGVVKRFKMYCSSRFQRPSAFSPFHALP
jgi:hypothetical protein